MTDERRWTLVRKPFLTTVLDGPPLELGEQVEVVAVSSLAVRDRELERLREEIRKMKMASALRATSGGSLRRAQASAGTGADVKCSCWPYVRTMGFHHPRCTAVNPNVR